MIFIQKMCIRDSPSDKKKVIVIGSGPIRIGQGIEFDYCSVHSVLSLEKAGIETIIINNNPETVSTDFDTSDKLYFEPLTEEDVYNLSLIHIYTACTSSDYCRLSAFDYIYNHPRKHCTSRRSVSCCKCVKCKTCLLYTSSGQDNQKVYQLALTYYPQ